MKEKVQVSQEQIRGWEEVDGIRFTSEQLENIVELYIQEDFLTPELLRLFIYVGYINSPVAGYAPVYEDGGVVRVGVGEEERSNEEIIRSLMTRALLSSFPNTRHSNLGLLKNAIMLQRGFEESSFRATRTGVEGIKESDLERMGLIEFQGDGDVVVETSVFEFLADTLAEWGEYDLPRGWAESK